MALMPVPGEGQDEEADAVAGAVGGAQVDAEGRLAVGARGHQVEAAAGAEDAGAEVGDGVAALVLEGHRRHRDEDVVGQQGHHRVEVGGLVGADEPREQLRPRPASRGAGGGSRSASGQPPTVQARARPLEGAGDRLDGRVQHLGRLLRGEPEDVAQDQHRDLPAAAGPAARSRRPGRPTRSARSGPPARGVRRGHPRRSASGSGSSQTTSPSRVGSGGSTPGTSHSCARRRAAERRALRQRLVAIL